MEEFGTWSFDPARRKDAASFVPALVKMLGSTDLNARYGASDALAKIGKPAMWNCAPSNEAGNGAKFSLGNFPGVV